MVLGINTTKKPRYVVKVETKPVLQGSGNAPSQQDVPKPKSVVTVENMTLDQLLSSYKKKDDDDDEPMLPGFNYLKKMKQSLKAERIKSVLKR
jgi:hypothetical protein